MPSCEFCRPSGRCLQGPARRPEPFIGAPDPIRTAPTESNLSPKRQRRSTMLCEPIAMSPWRRTGFLLPGRYVPCLAASILRRQAAHCPVSRVGLQFGRPRPALQNHDDDMFECEAIDVDLKALHPWFGIAFPGVFAVSRLARGSRAIRKLGCEARNLLILLALRLFARLTTSRRRGQTSDLRA